MKQHSNPTVPKAKLFFSNRKLPETLLPTKLLHGLFWLEQQDDGSVEAVLSRTLRRRSDASYLGMQGSPSSLGAYKAIIALLKAAGDLQKAGITEAGQLPSPVLNPDGTLRRDVERENANTRLIALAFFLVTNLVGVFAPLKTTKGQHLEKAKKRAKRIISEVIDKLADPLPLKSNVREHSIWVSTLNCYAPLPFVAIEMARRQAAKHRRLPTKSEVRSAVLSLDPELSRARRDFWSEVWREAGLDGLPKGKPVFAKQKCQLQRVKDMSDKSARK